MRSGQQQQYNYLNPAEVQSWEIKVRAYLEQHGCLDAITDPRAKDHATFAAENPTDDSGERLSHEAIRIAYKDYLDKRDATRRKAYDILVQWPGVLKDPQILHACEPGQPLDRQRDALTLYNKLVARKSCTDIESQEEVQRVLSALHMSANLKEAKAIVPQDISFEGLRTWCSHVERLWALDKTKDSADQSLLVEIIVWATRPRLAARNSEWPS